MPNHLLDSSAVNCALSPPKLFVSTVPLRDHVTDLVSLSTDSPLAWLSGKDGIVGWGEAARCRLGAEPKTVEPTDKTRFFEADRWLNGLVEQAEVEDQVNLPGTGPVAFGTFSFSPHSPGSALVVPRVLVGRRGTHMWLTTISDEPGARPEELSSSPSTSGRIGPITWQGGTLDPQRWMDTVTGTIERIRSGELEKAVLARDAVAEADSPIDVRVLLERLRRRFPSCFTFSVDGMVGATPELLLRREGDRLTSLVLAGTRARGQDHEEDRRLGEEMLSSPRTSRNMPCRRFAACRVGTIVEGTRGARSAAPVAPGQCAASGHARTGTSCPGVSALDAVAALHPRPLWEVPTGSAMRLIAEEEGMDRGGYAGPVGWMDGRATPNGVSRCGAPLWGARAQLFAAAGSSPVRTRGPNWPRPCRSFV